jgi:hypothetical protein
MKPARTETYEHTTSGLLAKRSDLFSEAERIRDRLAAIRNDEWKTKPLTQEYEAKAKNLLKGELKRRGLIYAQLVEKLATLGIEENERNLTNKISRSGFTAAFFLQCLEAIGSTELRLK